EQRVSIRRGKCRSGVEPHVDRGYVRRQFERRRPRLRRRHARYLSLQLRLADIATIRADKEWKSVMRAGFDQIDLVRRNIVAEVVLSGLAGPHQAGLRIPIEANRVVQAACVWLQRAVLGHDLTRRTARVSFDADVAGRPDRHVEPTVWPEVDRSGDMQGGRRAGEFDDGF